MVGLAVIAPAPPGHGAAPMLVPASILPAMDLVDQLSARGYDCVCGNLRMAARAVSSVYDRHLADAGVQSSQMAVLWAVSSADGITVKQLAGRMAMHETTLIRNLRILEREGWVALKVGADDRRQRIPSLTRSGRAVFGKALLGWKKAQAEIAVLLDDKVPETNRKLVRLSRAIWNA
jgi:DNA-binding MarR family transcriptional regulator